MTFSPGGPIFKACTVASLNNAATSAPLYPLHLASLAISSNLTSDANGLFRAKVFKIEMRSDGLGKGT